jgi:hypothetical protein
VNHFATDLDRRNFDPALGVVVWFGPLPAKGCAAPSFPTLS